MIDFLGNDAIRARLSQALAKGQLSHAYLLTGPAGSGKHTLARLLSAAMQCRGEENRPCLRCTQCRKVLQGVHPDCITVDDDEHKTIPVRLVRNACADLYTRPNEGARKIYLFPRAQDLNPQGQNALLKCIEEPPAYGAFFLLCEHAEQLLPTVRSRCVELSLAPLTEQTMLPALRKQFPSATDEALRNAALRSGGWLGQAQALLQTGDALFPQSTAFVQAYCAGTPSALLSVLVPMERCKREQLAPILEQWQTLLAGALSHQNTYPACKTIAAVRPTAALLSASRTLSRAAEMLERNVSAAHVCGMLAVLLR